MCSHRERGNSASDRLAEILVVVACGWPFRTVASESAALGGTEDL